MSDFDEHGHRIPDPDEVRDAYLERKRLLRLTRCQCGNDLPGRCPGPSNCPYADVEEDEDELS
jgi:hypothetical protein